MPISDRAKQWRASVILPLAACGLSLLAVLAARYGRPEVVVLMSLRRVGDSILPEYLWLTLPYLLASGLVWNVRANRSALRLAGIAAGLIVTPALAYGAWILTQPPVPSPTITTAVRVSYVVVHLLPLWQYFILLWLWVLSERSGSRPALATTQDECASVAFGPWRAVLTVIPAAAVAVPLMAATAPSVCCWTCGEIPNGAVAGVFIASGAVGPAVAVAALASFFETRRLPPSWIMGFAVTALAPLVLAGLVLLTATTQDGQGAMGFGLLVGLFWGLAWILTLAYAIGGVRRLAGPDRMASRWRLGWLAILLIGLFIVGPFIVMPEY